MQKGSVLVSSSAVLKAPQKITPPRKPPSVRKPRLSVAAGVETMCHAHKAAAFKRASILFVPGMIDAEFAHVPKEVFDKRPDIGLGHMAGGAKIAARGNVGEHLAFTVHVMRHAYHRRAGALGEFTLVTRQAAVGVDGQLIAFNRMRDDRRLFRISAHHPTVIRDPAR